MNLRKWNHRANPLANLNLSANAYDQNIFISDISYKIAKGQTQQKIEDATLWSNQYRLLNIELRLDSLLSKPFRRSSP